MSTTGNSITHSQGEGSASDRYGRWRQRGKKLDEKNPPCSAVVTLPQKEKNKCAFNRRQRTLAKKAQYSRQQTSSSQKHYISKILHCFSSVVQTQTSARMLVFSLSCFNLGVEASKYGAEVRESEPVVWQVAGSWRRWCSYIKHLHSHLPYCGSLEQGP